MTTARRNSRPPGGFSPIVIVDRSAGAPLHRQIYEAFRARILDQSLQPGQQIPSTRALAAELGISRIPVLEAYMQLVAEGYFETRVGAGTFVAASLYPQPSSGRPSAGSRANGSSAPRRISRAARLVPGRSDAPWTYGSGAFSVGQLAFDHFPFHVWSNLVASHARRIRAAELNYGDTMGQPEFRAAIAAYLRTSRGVHCDARQIMILSGSQSALDIS